MYVVTGHFFLPDLFHFNIPFACEIAHPLKTMSHEIRRYGSLFSMAACQKDENSNLGPSLVSLHKFRISKKQKSGD